MTDSMETNSVNHPLAPAVLTTPDLGVDAGSDNEVTPVGFQSQSKPQLSNHVPTDPTNSTSPSASASTSSTAAPTPPPATFRSVLAQPAVRALWIASFVSYLGDTFGMMALFILVNQVTHSTVAVRAAVCPTSV